MRYPNVRTTISMYKNGPPIVLNVVAVPAPATAHPTYHFWLGDLNVLTDFEHLESMAEQLGAYVAKERAKHATEAMQNFDAGRTTGEAGMAAGDPIGREAAKYLAVRHDTDEEYMEGFELWRGHVEAHS